MSRAGCCWSLFTFPHDVHVLPEAGMADPHEGQVEWPMLCTALSLNLQEVEKEAGLLGVVSESGVDD